MTPGSKPTNKREYEAKIVGDLGGVPFINVPNEDLTEWAKLVGVDLDDADIHTMFDGEWKAYPGEETAQK